MPVGIDMNIFHEMDNIERRKKSVLFLGRLSPVKNPELFLDAASLLSDYQIDIYGDDTASGLYKKELEERAGKNVHFYSSILNTETPAVYNAYEIYVNVTPKGSMDKTILEAAACGALVVVLNDSLKTSIPRKLFLENVSGKQLAERIREVALLGEEEKESYRNNLQEMVVHDHSLEKLGKLLHDYISA